jgi:hypothetical protein
MELQGRELSEQLLLTVDQAVGPGPEKMAY